MTEHDNQPPVLKDPEYWTSPLLYDEAFADWMLDRDEAGVYIIAPELVPLDARKTLPVVARVMLPRGGEGPRPPAPGEAALITAMRLEDGALYLARAWAPGRGPEGLPDDLDPDSEGWSLATDSLDLFAAVPGLRERPGTLVVRLIMRDWVSNPVRVQLVPSLTAYEDPEVAAYLEDHRERPPASVHPPEGDEEEGGLPSYRETANSPGLPDEPGIALACQRVVVEREGESWLLRGSFLLPVGEDDLLPGAGLDVPAAAEPEPEPEPEKKEEEFELLPSIAELESSTLIMSKEQMQAEEHAAGQEPEAAVRMSLVLTGADEPEPVVIGLRAPGAVEAEARPLLAAGHFTLDLRAMAPRPERPQTYFAYAFAGEHLAGPLPTALISELQLLEEK